MDLVSEAGSLAEVAARFRAVRRRTLTLCDPLTPEDMMIQSCPQVSPAKWRLAHTAWFFESFVLSQFLPGYRPFDPGFHRLFNSCSRGLAASPQQELRGAFSRPGLDKILHYRGYVDAAMEELLNLHPEPEALRRIELGVNHEQQHQELLLTGILHAFYSNPLRPVYQPALPPEDARTPPEPLTYREFEGGLRRAGFVGEGFCYRNELPRHRVWLEPFAVANRPITCGEYAAFMADGGYDRHELWLCAGWDAVQANGWRAPLYWTREDGGWTIFTLRGAAPLADIENSPATHVSFFEADAYARWSGQRLPTEFEWEVAAEDQPIQGNLLDSGRLLPACAPSSAPAEGPAPRQFYGDCWEWTASAYLGYPGYQPLAGAPGESNGKFMSGQMVLRGGSCCTPAAHIRPSYRNFLAPETRGQFSGIRLAK